MVCLFEGRGGVSRRKCLALHLKASGDLDHATGRDGGR